MQRVILIQSHDWGNDVSLLDYKLPFKPPARIVAVFENMVTGYCGGGDDPASPAVSRNVCQHFDYVTASGSVAFAYYVAALGDIVFARVTASGDVVFV